MSYKTVGQSILPNNLSSFGGEDNYCKRDGTFWYLLGQLLKILTVAGDNDEGISARAEADSIFEGILF